MKKLLCLIAAAVLLTGCSGNRGGETIRPPAALQEESSAAQENTTHAADGTGVTIAETALYNKDGITITAVKLENSLFGPTIHITASNDSGKNVVITTRRLSVNGYMLPTSGLYCEVAAGKKANDELTLMASELDQAGIETIAEVAFYLNIFDSDSYETISDSDLITVKTSAAGTFTQNVDDSGEQVYDKGGIRVVCKGLKQDLIWDGMVVFYMENLSDRPVTIYAENVSVNGYMVDVSLWADLRENTRVIDGMYLLDLESLELASIGDVENLEFSLRIVDGNDWSEIDTAGPISLAFQ